MCGGMLGGCGRGLGGAEAAIGAGGMATGGGTVWEVGVTAESSARVCKTFYKSSADLLATFHRDWLLNYLGYNVLYH